MTPTLYLAGVFFQLWGCAAIVDMILYISLSLFSNHLEIVMGQKLLLLNTNLI